MPYHPIELSDFHPAVYRFTIPAEGYACYEAKRSVNTDRDERLIEARLEESIGDTVTAVLQTVYSDDKFNGRSKDWKLERLARVDRATDGECDICFCSVTDDVVRAVVEVKTPCKCLISRRFLFR